MLLRSSHGRSLPAQMRFRTSGSEAIGHCVHLLSAHSSRRLSENVGTRPSSSLPFIWNCFCIAEYYNTLRNFVNLFFEKGSGTGLRRVESRRKNGRRWCSAIWIKNWTKKWGKYCLMGQNIHVVYAFCWKKSIFFVWIFYFQRWNLDNFVLFQGYFMV